jgi:hypothetical protein
MLKTFIVPPLDGEKDIEFGEFIPYFGTRSGRCLASEKEQILKLT